jgi:hypothetical protein
MKYHADLWLAYTRQRAPGFKKRSAYHPFKAIERLAGQQLNQQVVLAIQKH